MRCRATIAVFVIAALSPATAAQAGRFGPRSAIVDEVGVIDSNTRTGLNNWLLELERRTTAQVRVLIVNSTRGVDIYDYATDVFVTARRAVGTAEKRGHTRGHTPSSAAFGLRS